MYHLSSTIDDNVSYLKGSFE